jgi:hypothetical protein
VELLPKLECNHLHDIAGNACIIKGLILWKHRLAVGNILDNWLQVVNYLLIQFPQMNCTHQNFIDASHLWCILTNWLQLSLLHLHLQCPLPPLACLIETLDVESLSYFVKARES